MYAAVRPAAFDPWAELAGYEAANPALKGRYGATTVFVGTLRDFNQGAAVREMTLEHYPGMTEKYLESLARQALARHDILDTFIIHRVGTVREHEIIVVVAAWSAHRAAAFDACREMMEDLKSRAPFWKRELTDQGGRWVSPE